MSSTSTARSLRRPDWAAWNATHDDYTVGAEEEVMLVDIADWSLHQGFAEVRPRLTSALSDRLASETHGAAMEIATEPHPSAGGVGAELLALRRRLADELADEDQAAAGAGTHPSVTWRETEVTEEQRYAYVHETMRELARREPTYALHVHVAIGNPERAVVVANRMRAHLPLLLGLSANSPYWQGRDSGLASARISIFGAFPRTGIPRAFADYTDYVDTVETLIRCGAFPEPTFLWWDVRLQPRLGTVEVRIMDAQTDPARTTALVALVQVLARLEDSTGFASDLLVGADELLEENRFVASRDGAAAQLLDPAAGRSVALAEIANEVLEAAQGPAAELGCLAALGRLGELLERPAAEAQRELAAERGLDGLVAALSARFTAPLDRRGQT